jgi:hypothetical protein
MEGLFINYELLRMWNEVVVAYFNVLGFLCGTEKGGLKKKKVNVYLPSLMMKVPDHLYV